MTNLKRICQEVIEAGEKATARPWNMTYIRGSWGLHSEPNQWGWLNGKKSPAPEYGKVAFQNRDRVECMGSALGKTTDADYITLTANHADKLARALLLILDASKDHTNCSDEVYGGYSEGLVEAIAKAEETLND